MRFCGLAATIRLVAAMAVPAVPAQAEMRLLMFEQPGCIYCRQWNHEVGDAYDRTDEGRAAPLSRLQIADPLPEGLQVRRPPHLTPTFILASDGREIGRIEGYPGEDFFWGLLAELLATAPDG